MIDDPSLEGARHAQALRGLERINGVSRNVRALWPPIEALGRSQQGRPLRILDIATGAGDVPIRLWRKAQHAGLRLKIEGCDRSRQAVEHSRARAAHAGAGIVFFTLDALTEAIPGEHDVLMCSLFLHHLDDGSAVMLLRRMAQSARQLVLVNDLIRHPAGWALAYVGTRLLSASSIVHHDGPQSVRAAYTLDEVRQLARAAGLQGTSIVPCWPYRFLLSWRR